MGDWDGIFSRIDGVSIDRVSSGSAISAVACQFYIVMGRAETVPSNNE